MKKSIKRYLSSILMLVILISCINTNAITVQAAGADNWSLEIQSLTHYGMTLKVSGVDKAQNVTAYITADVDTFTRTLTFTKATQTFELTFDKGYDVDTSVSVYLQDTLGNRTSTESDVISEDKIEVWGKAYPKMYTGEIWGQNVTSVYAMIGFQKYDGVIDKKNNTVKITYPKQAVDTEIQIIATDGFCTDINEITIVEDYLKLPSIKLKRTQMLMFYDRMPEGCIIYAQIGNTTYQSTLGKSVAFENGVILEYPVQKEGQVVSVWMESEDGSTTKPKNYTIEKCKLVIEDGFRLVAYPKMLVGSVDTEKDTITYVVAQIGKESYKAKVDNEGEFVIEYPAQKVGTSITLVGYDEHGCNSEALKLKVENTYSIEEANYVKHIYLSQATGYTTYDIARRLCVQIGDKVYYSDYSKKRNQVLKVTYPTQKIGTEVKVWFEEQNGSYSKTVKKKVEDKKLYVDKYDLQTTFIMGEISTMIWGEEENLKLKSANVVINGKTYKGTIQNEVFSIGFPQQKLGQKVTLNMVDVDGYKCTETLEIVNKPIALDVNTIYYNSTKVTGTTVEKAKVVVKIGGKKYTATANASGKFSVNIKASKSGTGVSVTSTSPEGYFNTVDTKVESQYGDVYFETIIYKNTTTVNVNCTNGNKGDVITLKVGSNTYKKELSQTKKSQTVTFKIAAQSAGKQVKITLLDSFGKERGSNSTMVYIGDTIKVGMTEAEIVLTTWGAPVRKNNWSGSIQWVFERGSSTVYAYIKNGKVYTIQHLNY
ncbi:MAG: Ig-like domain-containing protein [Mobilitalea sp.]